MSYKKIMKAEAKMLSKKLIKIRKTRGFNRLTVEERAKISPGHMSRIEGNRGLLPSGKILCKLSELYGVPLSVFFLNGKAEWKIKEEYSEQDYALIKNFRSLANHRKLAFKSFLRFLLQEQKNR